MITKGKIKLKKMLSLLIFILFLGKLKFTQNICLLFKLKVKPSFKKKLFLVAL